MSHLLALIGLSLLCAAWVLFQRWLARQDPEKKAGYRPGCGACSNCSVEHNARNHQEGAD
jgi:hypothetical protein